MGMTDNYAIRLANPEDVPDIAKVVNGWIDGTDWYTRAHPPEKLEELIGQALPIREIWVHGFVADAYLSINPEDNHIGALYCAQPGWGVGKALMDRAKNGRDFISLNTHVANSQAQKFYLREGFKIIGERTPEPPETLMELRMEWRA